MNPTLGQLLKEKSGDIWSVRPDASVFEAITMLAEKGIGLLLVVDDPDSLPVGVISERDYARKIILQGRESRKTPVSDIMTRKLVYGKPAQTVHEGMAMMTDGRFRHLPVLENGRVLGVLSIGDLVKAVIADQQFRIQQLENYISG